MEEKIDVQTAMAELRSLTKGLNKKTKAELINLINVHDVVIRRFEELYKGEKDMRESVEAAFHGIQINYEELMTKHDVLQKDYEDMCDEAMTDYTKYKIKTRKYKTVMLVLMFIILVLILV